MRTTASFDFMTLGPDPNRTFLQRHNEMYPQRFGILSPTSDASGSFGVRDAAAPAYAGAGRSERLGLADSFFGLLSLVGGLIVGVLATVLAYKLTAPATLSALPLLGYAVVFGVSAYLGAVASYMLRKYVVAVAAIAGVAYAVYLVVTP